MKMFFKKTPNEKKQIRKVHFELIKESAITYNSEKKVPKVINIDSITKYEIDRIHNYALLFFENQEKNISFKRIELDELKNEDITHLTYVNQVSHLDKINKKENEIKTILEDKNRDRYLKEIKPLLSRCEDLFRNEEQRIFGMENDVSIDITKEMVKMIDIIRYFTPIEFNFNIKTKPCCACCNYDFSDLMPDFDGVLRCPKCSVENDLSQCSDKYLPEIDKFSINVYCDYNVENNFIKFLDKFQGKIPCALDKSIYKDKLDEYFSKKKKDIGDVVKQKNFDYKGFKEGTSLEMMLISLKEVKLSDFYDDVYFICKEYWGWILVDLDENIEKIKFIYKTTQTAYKNIENKKRSSSISIPFHTLKILELLGYKYGVSDFKIPKDEKSKRDLEEYWKTTCSKCDSSLIYYKPTKWES